MKVLYRVRNLFLHPKDEWNSIIEEQHSIRVILLGYVLPLASFRSVLTFLGWVVIGKSTQIDRLIVINPKQAWLLGLQYGLTELFCTMSAAYLLAYLISFLAPAFRSKPGFKVSLSLSFYTLTPVWVAGILNFIPVLAPGVTFAALFYSLVILWYGLKVMTRVPDESRTSFFMFIAVALFMSYYIARWLIFVVVTFFFSGTGTSYFA